MKCCIKKIHLRQDYDQQHHPKKAKKDAHRCPTDVPTPHPN